MTSQPLMSRCLSSCVAVSAKQSTIITHTSVRAEDCSRSSAGARKRQKARLHERSECRAYRSRDNLPHAITVGVSNLIASTVPECMKRARKRAIQKALRSKERARKRAIQKALRSKERARKRAIQKALRSKERARKRAIQKAVQKTSVSFLYTKRKRLFFAQFLLWCDTVVVV